MKSELRKGFKIDYDASQHVLIVRFLGVVDCGLATQCERRLRAHVREINAVTDAWYLVLDFSRCMPMADDAQDIIWHAIEFARRQGLRNKAMVTNGTLIGFKRASATADIEMQVDFYFQSATDAVRWLLDEPVNSG